jgi:hypothetical protein
LVNHASKANQCGRIEGAAEGGATTCRHVEGEQTFVVKRADLVQ